jgi:hypothetical protein
MHPAIIQICEDPKTGAEVRQIEKAHNCHEAAYAVTRLDVSVASLLQRSGYAANMNLTGSMIYVGLGGWLGPDGGGLDLFKAGLSIRQTLRESWDVPINIGASTLVFDQVHGEKRWGAFSPFFEFAFLFGQRNVMFGPYASVEYRWMFGKPDDLQFTMGLSFSVTASESVWTKPTAPAGTVAR